MIIIIMIIIIIIIIIIITATGRKLRTLQHVKADAPQLIDVWVVNLGEESDLGRRHWVVLGKEGLEVEHASCSAREDSTSHTSQTNAHEIAGPEHVGRSGRRGEPSYGEPLGPSILTLK